MKFRPICFFCCKKTKEDFISRESETKPRNLNGVEKLLGYKFKDNTYIWYPELSPGLLTQLRAANVDTEKLARVTIKHGLYRYLRHQKGNQIEDQIQEFREKMKNHPLHSMGLIKPPKVLADIVESQVGALFMDCGCSLDKLWPKTKEDFISRESETKPRNLNGVEKLLGYKFKDNTLLEKAFTHASCTDVKCESYERLEYVGDAVLNMLVARAFYIWYPELSSGLLTQLRAANVDTEKLARVAIKHGLYRYLRHQKGNQIEDQIQEFREEMKNHPLHSMGLIKPPKVLADIVESLVGALFMDCGCSLDKLWPIVKSLLEPMISPDTMRSHPKSELLELCQKKGWKIHYKQDLENGVINVFVEDRLVGKALFSSPIKKDVATNHAAKDALIHLKTATFLGWIETL